MTQWHMPSRRMRPLVATCLLLVAGASSAQDVSTEPRRETWQRVPDMFAALNVHEGARIADIGAGDGFLTVRLARAVGASGVVYAVDTDEAATMRLRERVEREHVTNVRVVVAANDDPHVPDTLDGAVILNAYHEMDKGLAVLDHLHAALKPGGRLVICEPVPDAAGESHAAQSEDHVIYPETVVGDVMRAGFVLLDRDDGFAKNLGGTVFGLVVGERR